MNEMKCLVQRFLICLSIEKHGKGFIDVREIGRLIAKLMYCIRACVYMDLMKRFGMGERGITVDKDLEEMGVYVRDLVQSSFEFLNETMHLTAAIVENSSVLSQIC